MARSRCAFVVLSMVALSVRAQLDVSRTNTSGIGPETVENFSGYVAVNKTRNLFYWFFESRNDPSSDPMILWMTGGPGCSGMLALLVENGPYHVESGKLALNPYSWNTNANILFIDQPVGSGFSYDSNPVDVGVTNERDMASNMHEFLTKWFAAHPKYAALNFFIAAESYGGHYAPALASYIQARNFAGDPEINLKGVMIGDGLVDPLHQYSSYSQYAKMHQTQMKLSSKTIALMEGALVPCLPLIKACGGYNDTKACQQCRSPPSPTGDCLPPKDDPKGLPCCLDNTGVPCLNQTLRFLACTNAYDVCNLGELIPIQSTGINLYDVTKPCTVKPLCYDFSAQTKWLNDPANIKALGAHKSKWQSCNREVEIKLVFAGDWMLSFAKSVRSLLESGIPMLVYHGENDIIVNWLGGQAWTNALKWNGAAAFKQAPNTTYTVGGTAVGSFKSAEGLTFMKLSGAGHLVPMDQPQVALDMLTKFLAGKPF